MSNVSNRERDLVFKVMNGLEPTPEMMTAIYELRRHKRYFEMLEFLIKERVVGKEFLFVLRIKHQGSRLNFMAWIIKGMNRDVAKRPIKYGSDWN